MAPTPVVGEILGPDLLVILAIVTVLFGSSKIPKLARSLGQASHEFHKGLGQGADAEPEPTPKPVEPVAAPAEPPAKPTEAVGQPAEPPVAGSAP
jgi:sec-independent protein translocase protein TatA